jgi:hypothetical protein
MATKISVVKCFSHDGRSGGNSSKKTLQYSPLFNEVKSVAKNYYHALCSLANYFF